ncbi:MAG TPA: 4Fe-4S dicluster domain-containing protein [Clostridiales bacterium]|nr:4Fe-4S dicluster domain-containing protein [Clostridiales bacterium]
MSGTLGKDIKKLGFGLMRLPMDGKEIDIKQVEQMVDRFMEEGFTYFDTAYVYHNGLSEVVAGQALVKRYPRESFQLATKMPLWAIKKPEDLQTIFDTQLERTGAGYFDYYLLHSMDKQKAEDAEKMGVWEFGLKMKEKGLVKHLGFSFHDTADALEDILAKHPEAEFVQLQINYADWDSEEIQSGLCYEVARKHNKPIIIMEPVKGGALAGMRPELQEMFKKEEPDMSIASWAVRYAASLEGVIMVLSGMSNREQMEDNLSYMKNFKPLQEKDRGVIRKVVEELNKVETIPCTGCKYCVDDCPQQIHIPDIFNCVNNYRIYQNLASARGSYLWTTGDSGKADACIECGSCESHCPQHIKIIDSLKEAAVLFK